ncbi:hypothetical protein DE146DRAFT_273549 [Phaeosphaeria sp. MPI-PUGE-AT-0046c]|nr:hypothetical protein DE146DRAFT_273549 [Phaeosphaeria sp. MPI-PUGE-AT-0046c]
MQLSIATSLAATLVVTGTIASPITLKDTSTLALNQQLSWTTDHCDHSVVGVVAGTSYIQMLRNSWQLKFASFGSTPFLEGNNIQGTCCAGQCLWIRTSEREATWNATSWEDALHRLVIVVKSGNSGLCGASIDGDEYLTLFTADGISPVGKDGRAILNVIGNSCEGNAIPWPEVYHA